MNSDRDRRQTVIICVNTRAFTTEPSCGGRGSRELADWLEAEIGRRGLSVSVDRSVCLGHCRLGPNVRLPGQPFIHGATKERLVALLDDLTDA